MSGYFQRLAQRSGLMPAVAASAGASPLELDVVREFSAPAAHSESALNAPGIDTASTRPAPRAVAAAPAADSPTPLAPATALPHAPPGRSVTLVATESLTPAHPSATQAAPRAPADSIASRVAAPKPVMAGVVSPAPRPASPIQRKTRSASLDTAQPIVASGAGKVAELSEAGAIRPRETQRKALREPPVLPLEASSPFTAPLSGPPAAPAASRNREHAAVSAMPQSAQWSMPPLSGPAAARPAAARPGHAAPSVRIGNVQVDVHAPTPPAPAPVSLPPRSAAPANNPPGPALRRFYVRSW